MNTVKKACKKPPNSNKLPRWIDSDTPIDSWIDGQTQFMIYEYFGFVSFYLYDTSI